MEKVIARGAEAVIKKKGATAVKERTAKGYRIKQLDDELRIKRTRSEAKILQKIPNAPKVIAVDETSIEMEYIDGDVIKEILDNRVELASSIGAAAGKMHDMGIVHGDLTTSNMILDKNNNVRFIDFGLSFVSDKVEDKAVDLHLFREALESKHFRNEPAIWKNFLKGYKPQDRDLIFKRLEIVEQRGRNKQKY